MSSVHFEDRYRSEFLGHLIHDIREGPLNPRNNFFLLEKAVSGPHGRMEKLDTDLVLRQSQEELYSTDERNLAEHHVTGEAW